MKLNVKNFRYLSPEDWRVLTAVEIGSKNHELVPTPLIIQLSSLKSGASAVQKCISTLARANLIAKVKNARYDGYRLTYGGLDYLALRAHTLSNSIHHLGSPMGTGKESDIWLVRTPSIDDKVVAASVQTANGGPVTQQAILKLHRLGRISFRSVSTKRAYQGNRAHCSWHHLSRLSAQKEYAAMNALRNAGFRVPRPIAQSRHTVVMSLVPGLPLRQVPLEAFGRKGDREERIARLYGECLGLALELAEVGVIHGDLNEFNVLVENIPEPEDEDDHDESDENIAAVKSTTKTDAKTNRKPMIPHIIDFPQITSMSHPQARYYFDRDVTGIKAFFRKKYHFESDDPGPTFEDAVARHKKSQRPSLDVAIEAAGFNKKMARELERYQNENAELDGAADQNQEEYEEGDEEDEGETTDSHSEGNVDLTEAVHGLDLGPDGDAMSFDLGPDGPGGGTSVAGEDLPPSGDSLSAANIRALGMKSKAKSGWAI